MDKNNIKSSVAPVSLTEHLSALLDDEAGSFEQRRVLDELKSDNELNQKLSSYALIGDVMRSTEASATVSPASFLAGIHDQIAADEVYDQVQLSQPSNDAVNSTNKSSPAWLRPVGGFALAASVAALAVVGFQNFQTSSDVTDMQVTTLSKATETGNLSQEKMAAATVVPATQLVSETKMNFVKAESSVSRQYKPADARTREFLKTYIDSHLQYASNSAFVPSVRVIAYTN